MKRRAFTLIELLVVIAVIGLLSMIAVVSMSGTRAKARDLKRKTDLKQLATAVELYYAKYDSYPSTGGNWWTTCRDGGGWVGLKGVTGASGWIPNLAPEFIGQLPLRSSTRNWRRGPDESCDYFGYRRLLSLCIQWHGL